MSTDLAKRDEYGEIAVDIMSSLHSYRNTDGKYELSTFDPATADGAEMLVLATIGDVLDLSSLANMEITIRHFLMHEASRESDGGLVETWQRIVLIDDKGKVYSCGSLGVKKCLEVFLRVRGKKLFDPPIKCTVKVEKLEGAKQWMTLKPDMDSLLCKTGKRK